jgi:cytochrome c-type biogenesis protein CcmH/NrfG
VKPDQAGYYSNLGIVLRARGKLDEALDAYRQSIRLDRGNADVHKVEAHRGAIGARPHLLAAKIEG